MRIHHTLLVSVLVTTVLIACASKDQAETADAKPEKPARAAHVGPVCLLKGWLPTGMKYEEIEEIDVNKIWYGGVDSVKGPLADDARELGANVILRLRTGMKLGAIALVRPYAEGQAAFAPDMTDELCKKLDGELL